MDAPVGTLPCMSTETDAASSSSTTRVAARTSTGTRVMPLAASVDLTRGAPSAFAATSSWNA